MTREIGAGEAPVKQEFILEKPAPQRDTRDTPQGDTRDTRDTPQRDTERSNKKRRRGGQNKKRRAYRQSHSDMLCQFLIRGEECRLGGSCKKSHDKEQFLANKGADIGEECVNYVNYGRCSYSIACRYSSSHLDTQLSNVIDTEKYSTMKVYEVKKTLDHDLQKMLRTKHVWFGKSYQFLEETGVSCEAELVAHLNKYKRVKTEENGPDKGQIRVKTENEGEMEGVKEGADKTVPPTKTSHHEVYSQVKEEYYSLQHSGSKSRSLDLRGMLYLSPLTTLGNLPFRRICVEYGADITCSEMALCEELLKGQQSEWALLKRHHTEQVYGVQICGSNATLVTKTTELLSSQCDVDFIDLNVGCPIDLVFNKGAGSALMDRAAKLEQIVRGMVSVSSVPVSLKMRTGTSDTKLTGVSLCERLRSTGISHLTVHGRTRQQRYTRLADWHYVAQCARAAAPVPLVGNGDVLSYTDYNESAKYTDTVMIGRGALIKPWLFKEVKEQRHIDMSSTERMDMLQRFTRYGLEHWGTDTSGVEKTRRFLLEWMSFLYRYIPVGVLEQLPQHINQRPPYYQGRDEVETLMCSERSSDWVKLSEVLLGRVPGDFYFIPKHAANAYS